MKFWRLQRPQTGSCHQCREPFKGWAWQLFARSCVLRLCHACFSDLARETQEMACSNPLLLAREMLGKEWENVA